MKRIILILFILIASISLTGCWSMREVNELGVCVGIGVDLLENDLLELTVQVLIPRRLAQEGYEGNAVVTYSTTGRTTFEVLRKITAISSRKIYIGHIQLIVLGDSIAKKGIRETVDFFERDHEFRRQALVLVAKDTTAREILETGSVFELIPAVHIANAINNSIHTGTTNRIILIELFREMNKWGDQLVLPTVINRHEAKPKVAKNLMVVGTAVFNQDKLVGYLDEYETRGYLWARGKLEGGIIVIPNKNQEEDLASLEVIKAKGKIGVEVKEDKFLLIIKVESQFNIAEQQGNIDLTSPEMMEYVKGESIKAIKKEIEEALYIGQKVLKVDYFGFGEVVSKNYPREWKEVKPNWNTVFSNSPVEIEVISTIRGSGQILEN